MHKSNERWERRRAIRNERARALEALKETRDAANDSLEGTKPSTFASAEPPTKPVAEAVSPSVPTARPDLNESSPPSTSLRRRTTARLRHRDFVEQATEMNEK
eukprot:4622360-Pleurochrysis_carterae.AAC.1